MTLSPQTTLQGGKYRIEATLGQGGFGITYLATHTLLDVKVAIKEFFMKEFCERDSDSHVSLGSSGGREKVERFRTKFVKEAQNIARLRHANIVRVTDIFEENGTAYYVMEYHDRGSLADLVKSRGHLSETEAVGYIRQIADALDYLHDRKINHLDVKPANVLLNEDGEAVLIDFGLAKHYDSEGNQTSTTPVGISHGYAPMEQYKRGGVGTFSPTSDVYSLGATLYKMLTGITPPEASDVNDDGLPPMTVEVSPAVRNAVEQAMQPRRKDRPQSIKVFLSLLSNPTPVVNEEKTELVPDIDPTADETEIVSDTTPAPEQITEDSTVTSTPKPAPKSKSRKGLIIGVVCALVVAIAGVGFYMSNQQRAQKKVSDIITINGVKGIVYKVDDDGRHGMAVSLQQTNCRWDDAKDWCSDLGEDWCLPSKAELQEIYRNKEQLNDVLSDSGYEQLYGSYWSSEEYSSNRAWNVNMYDGYTPYGRNKSNYYYVRAVSAF